VTPKPRESTSGTLVIHVATNAVLDISSNDGGHPDGRALIDASYRDCRKDPPTLVCYDHHSPVYLQRRTRYAGAEYHLWAITFDGSHTHSGEPAIMSDEHKRQTEYVVRAAERVGYHTATEVRLESRVRPDAIIYSDRNNIGIEIQRSHVTPKTAVERTAKAIQGGLDTSVWFSDRTLNPKWMLRVPSVGMNKLPWDVVPSERQVTVAGGAQILKAVRCSDMPLCPERRRGHCDKRHIQPEPWRGLTVDDVAEQVPNGQMIPIRYLGKYVHLVSPESLALYEDVTGRRAELTFTPAAEMRLRYDLERSKECRVEHKWPIRGIQLRLPIDDPDFPRRGDCMYKCGRPARLYPQGWLCDYHKP
jgi:hypothetical protein